MSSLKFIRYGAWAAVAALAIGAGYVTVSQMQTGGGGAQVASVASIGGPFTLVRGDGTTVTDKDFAGKPLAIFFGFTFCPDVCPTTLSDLQGWIEQLGPDADKMNYAFVSVDPERDTPQVIGDYVAAFDPRITPLTGSREQIDEVIKAYRVYAKKVPLDGGGYTMDHSAMIYLMDGSNRFVGTIAYEEDQATALQKLKNLIARNGA
ncbi:SCO family protein [Pannonibacter indicus]|jgi:protein SCO1/2|uniref:Cytochrome oxidase Cu insertion factor, SCO1/SenC/PrrC family n=1 Tax=Pannonibacter indicus TaxID=466044 RepID=A0A0K6HW12_9HYPH|nr:SCO family protein [Pannonibacter indicus]CUA95084.1 Cytochrome oxidase Cu insertion factor, SCO1/SenC/PrrC family [Pannonibacter indicus]